MQKILIFTLYSQKIIIVCQTRLTKADKITLSPRRGNFMRPFKYSIIRYNSRVSTTSKKFYSQSGKTPLNNSPILVEKVFDILTVSEYFIIKIIKVF